MSFDYKKEFKEFYLPKNKPSIILMPPINYISVAGKGDPNKNEGEYKQAISVLSTIAFTIKMSYKGDYRIKGYFDYVVPPLEGFWWQEGINGVDYSQKDKFNWISAIRLPDFVSKEDFDWAIDTASKKKGIDLSHAKLLTIDEGLCVQCMHIGSYDSEPQTVKAMALFAEKQGYIIDLKSDRLHHEIYISDPRRTNVNNLKTVIRHPIRNK